jgi:hypothetical protein
MSAQLETTDPAPRGAKPRAESLTDRAYKEIEELAAPSRAPRA